MDRRIEKFTPSRTNFYLFALLLFISGVFLSSCGASAGANAKKACGIVNNSLATYRTATTEANPAQSAQDKAKALTMLRNALPLAAIASGSNLEYQALKATLSESNRDCIYYFDRLVIEEFFCLNVINRCPILADCERPQSASKRDSLGGPDRSGSTGNS